MSRLFVSASSEYLHATTAAFTGTVFTISAWIYPDTLTGGNHTIVQVQNSGSGSERQQFTQQNDDLFILSSTSGTNANASRLNMLLENTWQHVGCVCSAANSRVIWHNGVKGTANTTSVTPSGLNSTSIGMARDSTPADAFSGRIARVAIWPEALSDNEMIALSRGVSPLYIRNVPGMHYWPIFGVDTPEPAATNSFSLTLNGALTKANGPPVSIYDFYRRKSFLDDFVVSNLSVADLVDDFDDNSIDTGIWVEYEGTNYTVAESGQQLSISNSVASTDFGALSSVDNYDATDSEIYFRLVDPGDTLGSTEAVFFVQLNADGSNSNRVEMNVYQGDLNAKIVIADTPTGGNGAPYHPVTMRWLRMRESSGTTYWEYAASQNGAWTTLHSESTPVDLTNVTVLFGLGEFVGTDAAGTAIIDNVNVPSASSAAKFIYYRMLS